MQLIDNVINILEKNKLTVSLIFLFILVLLICILFKLVKFSNIEGATSMQEKEASATDSINNNSNSDEDEKLAEDAGCGKNDGCEDMETEAPEPRKKYI